MQTFKIKKEHILLLKNMYVTWWDCEFGAPAINGKRPYGNSNIYCDIAKIIGLPIKDEEDYTDKQIEKMNKLHEETETVLQIVLANLQETDYLGIWKCDDYDINWHR